MKRIDAHQHFWQYDPVKDDWITTGMEVIKRDFMPLDLWPLLAQNKIDGCIAVQASQSEAETAFLLKLASEHDFILGVVGWTDLRAPDLEEKLKVYSNEKKLKGFRHILQAEDLRSFLADGQFERGLAILADTPFTYDFLVYHHQLKEILPIARRFPAARFVLDHLGKPDLKSGEIKQWKADLIALGGLPNVYCKLSGLVTEGDWVHWEPSGLAPYLDGCMEAFGTARLLFGSDWPVCLLATSYSQWLSVLESHFDRLTSKEKAQIFGGNAARFYGIE